jgi:DNA-directed RNA polymerase subunit RPC12/RpoP
MKSCLKCGKEIDDNDDNENYCVDCGFERLKKYIDELYAKQVQEEKKNKSS